MRTALRLLVAEDYPADAELLIAELRRAGYEPQATVVDNQADFSAALEARPQIVLSDYTMPSMTAPDVLAIVAEREPDLPVIVVSGTMDEATCVNSLRLGASDYLLKDRLSRLGPAVEHALARRELDLAARAAEQQRLKTTSILNGLVEHAVAAIAVHGPDGEVLVSNEHYRQLHDTADPPPPDPAHVIVREEKFEVEAEPRTYYGTHFPVRDRGHTVFAVGSILVDITAQKQTEAELRQTRRELQERAEHLDRANAELRELDRMKTEFVASVSHELRTPLTSICGYAEMLLDAASTEQGNPTTRMLEVVDRNGRRLLSLVEDLLLLSQIDSASLAHQRERTDVAELAESARTVLEPAAEQAGVQLVTDVVGPLPVEGDRSQLERVLLNLLSNAVKFSHRGGVVTIRGRCTQDQVLVQVRDTGIGVAAEELPQLFTRFFRSSRDEAHSIPGTGLGLAVVREIVEQHGGEVAMASELGHGSVVTVRLPRAAEPEAVPMQRGRESAEAAPVTSPVPGTGDPT